MDNKQFKLNIAGIFDTTISEGDLAAHGTFVKNVWPEICTVLERYGVKNLTTASLDAAGKNVALPTDIKAGVAR